MRDDQLKRLDDIAERLMDTFVTAADPNEWTGANMAPNEMDPATRGARNWDVKNANQIGALTARALDLKERFVGGKPASDTPDDAAEADISRFEKQAKEVMKRAGLVRP